MSARADGKGGDQNACIIKKIRTHGGNRGKSLRDLLGIFGYSVKERTGTGCFGNLRPDPENFIDDANHQSFLQSVIRTGIEDRCIIKSIRIEETAEHKNEHRDHQLTQNIFCIGYDNSSGQIRNQQIDENASYLKQDCFLNLP